MSNSSKLKNILDQAFDKPWEKYSAEEYKIQLEETKSKVRELTPEQELKLMNKRMNLRIQVTAIYKKDRHGSQATRKRYYQAACYACDYIAGTCNLQKFANFHPKHFREVAEYWKTTKGTNTIYTELAGLRQYCEYAGCKYKIDFERGTLTIKHTVTSVQVDGKTQMYAQDSAKTKSSMRTLPLVGSFAEYFKEVKAAQELNKQVCGNCYNYEYDGYVFVDELGNLMRPDYLTGYFPQYIQKHGLRRMRFHDLRHSCASLLLANGVPLKQIQDWLGHSDFSTTANIYAHLDYSSKLSSAQAMVNGMALPETVDFGSKWETVAEKCRE